MTRRLVIITEIISPYRIPLFNALAQRCEVDLHVIFLAETDPSLRQWHVYKDEIKFSYQILDSYRRRIGRFNLLLNRGCSRALSNAMPNLVLCGGYNYVAAWEALFWARHHGVPFFLWSESNLQDIRQGLPLVEFLKAEFISRCSGFVVPGRSAKHYLRWHGVRDQAIVTAPNAVDNEFFSELCASIRENAAAYRAKLSLPERYFLFLGRLVPEKGVFDLLSAYAKLEESLRQQVGLVFAGDGESRQELQNRAFSFSPRTVAFVGFVQREQVAAHAALAEMLVLPTYSDPWGLVVNEAMACALPVIVTNAAGCAADLVTDNWNGRLVHPGDVTTLASAMRDLALRPRRCAEMGANSLQRIAAYSPAEWANAIVCLVSSMGDSSE